MNWLYENSRDNTSRFILGTVGKNPLVCFGINPSTAVPQCLDNTLKSVERIALANIKKVLKEYKPTLWAAWGTIIENRNYLPKCLSDIARLSNDFNCSWITYGKVSKDGHPHHPLYLSEQATKAEFLINDYMKNVENK